MANFRIVVLNGGSSSGKSTIARCLRSRLPEPWLTFSVDTLMDAMPPRLWGSRSGIEVASDGQITVGPAIRVLRSAWLQGVAAIAHAGVGIILDEVFLEGAAARERWRVALDGQPVLWVGVRCDPRVATAREVARGDRDPGMAATQACMVHRGVVYDMEVDTAEAAPMDCARLIAERLLTREE
jgi:chloramphenicol 3-O phosphotransferase